MAPPSGGVDARVDLCATELMWNSVAALRNSIDDLEFLHRLGDGTLPAAAFRRYIEQDAVYLRGYAKALALLATRAPDADAAVFWASASASAITVEAQLHRQLLTGDSDSLPPLDGSANTEPREELPPAEPTCLGYLSYLIATAATEPYPVGAAAVLPCFWIYADVGGRLSTRAEATLVADPDHPYARWVAAYGDPAFREQSDRARDLVDRAAAQASLEQRAAMQNAFEIATRYELAFWDTALYPQPWSGGHPVAAQPVGGDR